MDMSKYNPEAKENNDLKASDNQGKTFKLTIREISDVTYPPSKWNPESETKPTLFFLESDKRLVVNRPNNQVLCDAYKTESKGWEGKRVAAKSVAWSNGEHGGWMWELQALDQELNDDIPF